MRLVILNMLDRSLNSSINKESLIISINLNFDNPSLSINYNSLKLIKVINNINHARKSFLYTIIEAIKPIKIIINPTKDI